MKQIVHWQIVMVIVTIGTYAAVLAGGGSELTAVAAFAAVAAVAVAVAAGLNIPRRWAFTAYGIEAAIFGALVLGSVGWAVAIGAVAVVALIAVWKFGPVAAPVTTVPYEDARQRELDRRIAETERTLADLRAQRAALDTSDDGSAIARKCGV